LTRFVGGPLDGQERDIHRNTEQLVAEGARYVRRKTDADDVFVFDADHQRRQEDEVRRAEGQSLDERMQQFVPDTPRAPRRASRRRAKPAPRREG
jgi:hypothetical protein